MQQITGQLANILGQAWAIAGKTVNWSMLVFDLAGNQVTDEGSLSPLTDQTDVNGKARTILTVGPTADLIYFVYAEVQVT